MAAVRQIPYDRSLISPMLQMGFLVESEKFSGTPDMVLSLGPLKGSHTVCIPIIGECAFSQRQDELERKLMNEIETCPEVIMVIMVVIKEADTFRGPADGSAAWNEFCDKPFQSSRLFFAGPQDQPEAQAAEHALSQPIVVRDHVWCHISSTDDYVWVKEGDEQIDIEQRDAEHMAHGLSMDAVKEMVSNRFVKIKNYIANMGYTLDPSTDVSQIKTMPITLPLEGAFFVYGLQHTPPPMNGIAHGPRQISGSGTLPFFPQCMDFDRTQGCPFIQSSPWNFYFVPLYALDCMFIP
ncbi:hypothetical protein PAXRUDRAFT_12021 [Paxillus rubicundulus Ve08.2h10]|uniref:Uncharacterized protein n=1 Tax=Paxillus rubicundulus Ve08.2h10 TaxID=930991 RepID=A0A0D0DWZ4_9AGAM|nr:hypothetical protein PAXRUDRAFT_12021 [Paxillus rubicundulus Ve08.2h10]